MILLQAALAGMLVGGSAEFGLAGRARLQPTLSPPAAAAPPVAARQGFGIMSSIAVGSAATEIPQAPIRRIVGLASLAETTDGDWIRWRSTLDRDGRVHGLEVLERLDAAAAARLGWPLEPPPQESLPADVPGETGCRLLSGLRTAHGRLGAWNCDGAAGTLLGVVSGGQPHILARLPAQYQAMAVAPVLPHGEGVLQITLAAYDPAAQRFDYALLAWLKR